MIRDVPSCTTISSFAYRGISVDGKVESGTAAPIGARPTSIVGCDRPRVPAMATVNGMSNRSIMLLLPETRRNYRSRPPLLRSEAYGPDAPPIVVSVAAESFDVTDGGKIS